MWCNISVYYITDAILSDRLTECILLLLHQAYYPQYKGGDRTIIQAGNLTSVQACGRIQRQSGPCTLHVLQQHTKPWIAPSAVPSVWVVPAAQQVATPAKQPWPPVYEWMLKCFNWSGWLEKHYRNATIYIWSVFFLLFTVYVNYISLIWHPVGSPAGFFFLFWTLSVCFWRDPEFKLHCQCLKSSSSVHFLTFLLIVMSALK